MSVLDSDVESEEIKLEYEKILTKTKTENFQSFEESGFLSMLGKDADGLNTVLCVPYFLYNSNIDPEKALHYLVYKLESVVKTHYALLICQTKIEWMKNFNLIYFKQCYDILPRQYKKNLKRVYILHAGIHLKAFLMLLEPITSPKFWKKLVYIDSLKNFIKSLKGDPVQNLRKFPYVVQKEEEIINGAVDSISYFGSDLETLSCRFGINVDSLENVPSILVKFVQKIESNPNIYNTKEFLFLQPDAAPLYAFFGDIESGDGNADWTNPACVITAFRVFIDSLAVPLLGNDAYNVLSNLANSNPSKREIREELQMLYDKLEEGHKNSLKFLLMFFRRIHKNSSTNFLPARRIAELFAAAFCRPSTVTKHIFKFAKIAVEYVTMLIIEYEEIFDSGDEEETSEEESSEYEVSEDELSKSNTENSQPKPVPSNDPGKPVSTNVNTVKAKEKQQTEEESEEEEDSEEEEEEEDE